MKDDEMKLLLQSLDAELGESDRARLDALLEASPELCAEQVRLRRMRTLVAESAADGFGPDFADRVLSQVFEARDKVHESRYQAQPSRRPSESSGWMDRVVLGLRSWRLAAGLAAAVVFAVVAFLWLQPKTVAVPYAETEIYSFGDGSTVELSGGSSITYRRFLGRSERRVTLEGEAFFDVAENEKPFIVETFNSEVTVLGTRFNVRAWPDDPEPRTEVAVASGRVSVDPRPAEQPALTPQRYDDNERRPDGKAKRQDESAPQQYGAAGHAGPIMLRSGQAVSVSADAEAEPRDVSLDRVLAWRTGGLAFVDQPLGSVFRTIERRFGVDVETADPAIRDRLLTYLNPRPSSAADVLADICHTLDLRYRQTANGFEVLPSSTTGE